MQYASWLGKLDRLLKVRKGKGKILLSLIPQINTLILK